MMKRNLFYFFSAIILLGFQLMTISIVQASPIDVTTLYPTDDAYIRVDKPDLTGDVEDMYTMYSITEGDHGYYIQFTLVKFDLSGFTNIAAATFRIFDEISSIGSSTTFTTSIKPVTKQWYEDTVTYNNIVGGAFGSTVASKVLTNSDGQTWLEYTVTGLAQGWAASPSTNYGVSIGAGSDDVMAINFVIFASKEQASYSPELVVTYGIPEMPVTSLAPILLLTGAIYFVLLRLRQK